MGRATRRHPGWPLSVRHRTGLLHPSRPCPAEGPSAECFDGSLPRHPPEDGPGACPSVLPLSPDQIALASLLPDVMWKASYHNPGRDCAGELAGDVTSELVTNVSCREARPAHVSKASFRAARSWRRTSRTLSTPEL